MQRPKGALIFSGESCISLCRYLTCDVGDRVLTSIRVVLEGGIYMSHIVWRIRYRHIRQEAKTSGRSVDEVLAERNGRGDVEGGEK
jgi:hypothetical protein